MTIADDYLTLVRQLDTALDLPAISAIHIAPANLHPGQSCKFGAMVLDDGTVGLTYVALEDTCQQIHQNANLSNFVGQPVQAVADLYGGSHKWQWALGLAAINAISQFVLQRTPQILENSEGITTSLSFDAHDRIGMVGYFPSLVKRIRAAGVPLTVIELDPQFLQEDGDFLVTGDTRQLNTCNKVICTGTTLVNQTLDDILEYTGGCEEIHLLGPTMGSLPDPLFARGVTLTGGRRVLHTENFINAWRSQHSWNNTSARYHIQSSHYRDVTSLINTPE